MSLVRRAIVFFCLVLLLAAALSLWVAASSAHQWAQAELLRRNTQAAVALATQFSNLAGDVPAMHASLKQQMQAQAWRGARVALVSPAGRNLIDVPASPMAAQNAVPVWFAKLCALTEPAGRASVTAPTATASGPAPAPALASSPATATATLRPVGDVLVAFAGDDLQLALWTQLSRAAALWAALGVVGVLLLAAALRASQRPMQLLLTQAQGLAQGQFIESQAPAQADLAQLSSSLNATAKRLRSAYEAQADQVAMLQRQAQMDAVTGLPLRYHFLGQLQQRLAETGGPPVALLLLRVQQLDALNAKLGHAAIDQLLGAIADVVLTYLDRVGGTFGGRLNGSDIALCLPVEGVALETAVSLHATLAALPAMRSAGAQAIVGGVDGLHGVDSSAALAAADAALARAEAQTDADLTGAAAADHNGDVDARAAGDTTGLVVVQQGEQPAVAGGSRAWREQISLALADGRAQLAEFKVVDSAGRVTHLECPLRVQLTAGGEYQAAARWLALAQRSRLMPRVDLMAVELALMAIATDGQARAVHASLQSLETPGFIGEVSAMLQGATRAAALLSIEIVEGARPTALTPLTAAAVAWRPWGTRVGVEHAGASPQQLPGLQAAGAAYVKVSARHLRGAASDLAVRGYAQSLVALIHGLGQKAVAEGMDDAQDVAALWDIGFDAATGPALS
jgi:EAL domain-containing protein (putative c-di-GMP-specific phosphodiesterase class I)/GGDEF domain-containing protein